jgi:cell division protein FtsX
MIGMLIGIASLSAWGLYRFNQHLASLPAGTGDNLMERLAAQAARVRTAYVMQYGEIFGITAIVCVIGALLGLLISGRHEHADEAAPGSDADDAPTALIDAPPPGRHRSR